MQKEEVKPMPSSFCHPKNFMMLSSVMLTMSFVRNFFVCDLTSFDVFSTGFNLLGTLIGIVTFKSSPFQISPMAMKNGKINVNPKHKLFCKNKKARPNSHLQTKVRKEGKLARLILLSASSKLHQVPTLATGPDRHSQSLLKPHRSFNNMMDSKRLLQANVPFLPQMKECLTEECTNSLMPGCHPWIADTGCASSCTPHKEDFAHPQKMDHPVTMEGVTGSLKCECGGLIDIQTIDANGKVVNMQTP